MDPYATHLPVLVREALQARGPILELGCGDYSTPVLAEIAQHVEQPFFFYSADPVWSARYPAIQKLLVNWSSVKFPTADIVFLDNEQFTKDRIRHLPALALTSRVVVVHDLGACSSHAHWRESVAAWPIVETYPQHNTAVLRRN